MSAESWVVIEICCDGKTSEASRHDTIPIAAYRRLGDTGDHVWAPIYSAGNGALVDNRRQWLDADNRQIATANAFAHPEARSTDSFECTDPACGIKVDRRQGDVAKLLDAAHSLGWTQVMLRTWANSIR